MRGMRFETTKAPADDPNNVTLTSFTCGLTGPGFANFWIQPVPEVLGEPVLSGTGIDTL